MEDSGGRLLNKIGAADPWVVAPKGKLLLLGGGFPSVRAKRGHRPPTSTTVPACGASCVTREQVLIRACATTTTSPPFPPPAHKHRPNRLNSGPQPPKHAKNVRVSPLTPLSLAGASSMPDLQARVLLGLSWGIIRAFFVATSLPKFTAFRVAVKRHHSPVLPPPRPIQRNKSLTLIAELRSTFEARVWLFVHGRLVLCTNSNPARLSLRPMPLVSCIVTIIVMTIFCISSYSFGFPVSTADFAGSPVSIGFHQGYTGGVSLVIVPVNLGGRLSKKDLTPSSLSL